MARRRDEEDEEELELEDDYEMDDEEEEEKEYDDGCGKAGKKRSRSDYIDEDDEDEEDEDYGGGKRNKKRSGSHFFDLEAAVDSEDDEEEEEDGEDDFIVDAGADIAEEYDSRQIDRHRPILDEEEDFEALERSIQARYARSSDDDEEASDDVDQQALLPCVVRDPKLWMVKCAIGHEREVAVCLMQKCIERGADLQIRSVIALDHLQNYIYIEAHKEAHVREACKNMRMIYPAKIMLVPIKEMTGVLCVESKAVDLARDTWVRMKTGTYKGDLAKVVDVDNVIQRVTVKLIPRVDLQALANKLEGMEVPKRKAIIPPPRLMNIDEARKMNVRVERRRDPMTGDYFDKIGGMMFKDGFLYKTMAMKSISSQNIEPSFDELEKFRQPGESDMGSLSTLFANRKKGHFMKGDRVIVVKGDLKNLKGCVEKVEENTVHIRPKEMNLPKTIAVCDKELCKYFERGNHVKVISGASEGATGMVVSVEGHVVNLVSDTTKEIIRVFADTVVVSSEVTCGATRIGDYELHDLVLLEDKSFGVIIGVESEGFQVLKGVPKEGEVALVSLREIKAKVYKKGSAHDRYQNGLAVKDVVKILEGPYKEKQGPVEHIYRGMVFIYDRHHLEHGGFICAKAQSCVLFGGSRPNADRKAGPFSSSFGRVSQFPVRSYRGGPPKNFGGRHGHNALIGADVKIRVGPLKGCKGRVVNLKGSSVLVELEAQMKVVTVDRGHIMENVNVRTPFREPSTYGFGSKTQSQHPSQTPLHPLMTPMRDSGAATPIHDGMRTPMRERAWNP
ncbi:PREDICTED: putative transcription elongation factor SPT5 homolog 1 [Ipomoea nil]|uniref:putative transcription elongation factor SPT5 homolog 1 n=1 Tax=Ipomoea nil TaxID=35883 RepID=UPI0009008DE5|nr:PREDICTED: putative transcription elongation factor SPT5 homolog 1 [Ipomoea nil]